MNCLSLAAKSEYLTWLSYLRHELYTPLNAIQGYSDFASLLRLVKQMGEQIYTLINQSMKGNQSSTEQQVISKEEVSTDWSSSWTRLRNETCIQQLQPLSQALDLMAKQLEMLAPISFLSDIRKVAISTKNFQEIVYLVAKSETWPCKLRLESAESTELAGAAVDPQAAISEPPQSATVRVAHDVEQPLFSETIAPHSSGSASSQSNLPSGLPTVQAAPTVVSPSAAKQFANVLVVDDNGANCDLLCRYIIRQGHRATPVPSGRQALSQIQTGVYDLILLDILMPEMNGYEVLAWIRKSEWRHLSVIMISSLDEIDSVIKCIEMGAEDYLPKPFNPTLLKARVDACLEKKKFRDQEVSYLAQLATANEQIVQLNDQLRAENGRLSSELDISRHIQQMMLPKPQELAKIANLEVVGFMRPADEVGGDYYDVICTNNGVVIGIGDVTGHGLESGLLMLMIQTSVRALVEQGCCDYQQFFNVINRTILSNVERMGTSRNSTLALVHYEEGRLKISGQHEEVIIIRNDGRIERIDTINLGFPMGLDSEISDFLGQIEIDLNLQDILILYTDGITEAEDEKGQFYGIDRLTEVASKRHSSSATEICDAVISSLIKHIGNQRIFDDITLLVMKRNS
jgi:serine phosphatase RsbU (regulator of sigma subunit)